MREINNILAHNHITHTYTINTTYTLYIYQSGTFGEPLNLDPTNKMSEWDSNVITPGTPFMEEVSIYMFLSCLFFKMKERTNNWGIEIILMKNLMLCK